MKRLRHILLNAATAFSALLCLAALALRIRGGWVEDYAYRGRPGGSAAVVLSGHGSLWVGTEGGWPREGRWRVSRESLNGPQAYSLVIGWTGSSRMRELPGIDLITARGWISRPPSRTVVATPSAPALVCVRISWWLPMLLTAVLPAARLLGVSLRRLRLRRRLRAGLCPACGYDLRASPRRCPECGLNLT